MGGSQQSAVSSQHAAPIVSGVAQTPIVAQMLHETTRELKRHRIDDAQLEAEVMLAAAMRIDRTRLLARLRDAAPADSITPFETMVARRLEREPLAYILGRREFYGIEIECAAGALIPRPETELLVELVLDEIATRAGGSVRVADVGTGSGAIAVAIALNASGARVTAIDASAGALAIARRTVARYEMKRSVTLVEGDLLAGAGTFDGIVANLPYVAEDEWPSLALEIREHEPREALVAGAAGTELIERLLEIAPAHLAPGGLLAAEIGCTQGARVLDVARRRFPDAECEVRTDLGGLDRVLVVRKHQGG